MEFEDQEEEHEEQEDEEEGGGIPITGCNSSVPSLSDRQTNNEARSSSSSSPPPSPLSLSIPPALTRRKPAVRYRECLKNHAVGIGGHAVDGCGEFLPAGEEGSIDALKCAACNCHRNFHRKEVDLTAQSRSIVQSHQTHHHQAALTPISYYPNHQQPQPVFQFHPYGRTISGGGGHQQPRPLALPSTSGGGDQERETTISNPMAAMGLGSSGKKRHRTKFTAEQKEKMMELAERIGWRLQKQNEGLVQQFCHETGLNRHVLKVWLHNNKHTLGKKP